MKLAKMLWAVAVPLDLEPMEVSLVEHLPERRLAIRAEMGWLPLHCLS